MLAYIVCILHYEVFNYKVMKNICKELDSVFFANYLKNLLQSSTSIFIQFFLTILSILSFLNCIHTIHQFSNIILSKNNTFYEFLNTVAKIVLLWGQYFFTFLHWKMSANDVAQYHVKMESRIPFSHIRHLPK